MDQPSMAQGDLSQFVELEPSDLEEWNERYRAWKKAELEDLWIELKRIEETRLRQLHNRRKFVEQTLGIRLNVRVPRKLITPPTYVAERFGEFSY